MRLEPVRITRSCRGSPRCGHNSCRSRCNSRTSTIGWTRARPRYVRVADLQESAKSNFLGRSFPSEPTAGPPSSGSPGRKRARSNWGTSRSALSARIRVAASSRSARLGLRRGPGRTRSGRRLRRRWRRAVSSHLPQSNKNHRIFFC